MKDVSVGALVSQPGNAVAYKGGLASTLDPVAMQQLYCRFVLLEVSSLLEKESRKLRRCLIRLAFSVRMYVVRD